MRFKRLADWTIRTAVIAREGFLIVEVGIESSESIPDSILLTSGNLKSEFRTKTNLTNEKTVGHVPVSRLSRILSNGDPLFY
jgi:hypothetical protein